jgi:hypothetical protein
MSNCNLGWALVIAGVVVLAAKNDLNLLVILLPVATVLAYSFTWLARGHRA